MSKSGSLEFKFHVLSGKEGDKEFNMSVGLASNSIYIVYDGKEAKITIEELLKLAKEKIGK